MGSFKYLFSGVRLLTVLSITAIVGGIVLQSNDIAETAKRLSDSPLQLQGWIRGQGILVSQAGDCSHEPTPNWPDCEVIECMSDSHYACTKMKPTAGGGGGTVSCQGEKPTNDSWCEGGVWKQPATGGSAGGGTWCSGPPPTSTSSCNNGVWQESTSGYTGESGGEWEASPAEQETCRNDCVTNGHFPLSDCQTFCKDGNWSGPGGGGPSMNRCFYTNATINSAKTGFTVWCEGDYFNCHEGSPSGQSISNTGLQLGAPSNCEGESGGGSGAGGRSDGGVWQEPNPIIDKPLEKAQCSRDPKTGALAYFNATIKGWTVVPKYDCESRGLRPGQTWSDQQHPAPGDVGGHEGDFGGIGDYMGDLGGYGGREGGTFGDPDFQMAAPPFVDDKFQLEREKKDMARNLQQREREIKDMYRNLKQSRTDDPSVAAKIDALKGGLDSVGQCFERAGDFDDMRDCYDQNNDLNEQFQTVWASLQGLNIKRDIENSGREEKNMTREIDRLSKRDIDTSELESLLSDWQSARANVLSLIDSDPEEAQYSMQDVWDAQQAFWEAAQRLQWEEQTQEMERHGCKDFEREAKRVPKEFRSEVDALVQKCKDLIARVTADVKSGEIDPQDANEETGWQMEDLWQRFQGVMESQWNDQACHDVERGLQDMEGMLGNEIPGIIDEVRGEHPAIADKMDSLLTKAESILDEAGENVASDDCESAMDRMSEMDRNIRPRFEDLMRQAGMDPDDFEDNGPNYRNFYGEFEFEDFDHDDFENYLTDQEYDTKTLSLAKRIAAEVLEQYFTNQRDTDAPDLLKSATDLGIGTLEIQKLLEAKNTLLAEINALRSEIEGLKDELIAIADEVARFTFGEETAEAAEEFVKNELPHLTEEEAVARLEELKEAAGEELYEDGLIPFEDTYLGEWYTDDAKVAKELGLVEGTGESDGTELNPAGETNIAEAITMFARLGGIDEDAVPVSDIGTDLPQWAESAAGTLEDSGVDLDTILGDADASDAITRGEVAVLLTEVLDLPKADPAVAIDTFSDVTGSTPDHVVDAIAAVYDAGLMTGYRDGSDDFGVDDFLDRAALVTILNRSHEEFAGIPPHEEVIDFYGEELDFDVLNGEKGEFDLDELSEEDVDEEEDEEDFDEDEEHEVEVESHTDTSATVRSRTLNGVRPSRRALSR